MHGIYIVMAMDINGHHDVNVIKAFNDGFDAIDFRDKMNETNGTNFSYYIEETELISEDDSIEDNLVDYGEAGCLPTLRTKNRNKINV